MGVLPSPSVPNAPDAEAKAVGMAGTAGISPEAGGPKTMDRILARLGRNLNANV
jgi:hypothetical protein